MTAEDSESPGEGPEQPPDIGAQAHTAITANRGAVNSGAGDQTVYITQIAEAVIQERRRLGPLSIDEHTEQRLTTVFVAPEGYDEARAVLRERRVVVLCGDPGSGLRTSAVNLLAEHRVHHGGGIRDLHASDGEDDDFFHSDDITTSASLLADFSGTGDATRRLARLETLLTVVRDKRAALAVVLRGPGTASIPDELGRARCAIARPDGVAALLKNLEYEGVAGGSSPEWPPGLHEFVGRSPLSDIGELARKVVRARATEPTSDFGAWVGTALNAVRAGESQAVQKLGATQDGRTRALAFAAAMFEGCSVDTVFAAESRLLHAVGLTMDDHDLARPDFHRRLDTVGVRVVDGCVHFEGFDAANSVRHYFWERFPGQRRAFHDWLVDAPAFPRNSRIAPHEYVGRYVDHALEVDRTQLVADAIETWTDSPSSHVLAGLALTQGVLHRRHGAFFRRRCYDWATTDRTTAGLLHLVATVSAEVIAPEWPGQAIVRLHHLTQRSDRTVAAAARDNLKDVTRTDIGLRHFVHRIDERRSAGGAADHDLFLDIVDPARLAAAPSTAQDLSARLVSCWAAVFRGRSKETFSAPVRQWLTAESATVDGAGLAEVLGRAANAPGRGAALHALVHDWLAEPASEHPTQRRAAARRLLAALDRRPPAADH
ncbi:hypothetical protein WIS52_18580 [Pseudonocardia nematodicida]|uniref:Uncharacterized protein n=1 Tax=Pseudonocardia nematodicida TaxID=1206997 RepID=A0ABV1KDG1_9PSEU